MSNFSEELYSLTISYNLKNNTSVQQYETVNEHSGVAQFDLIIGVAIPGILCILGMLGNSASFFVLLLDRSKSVNLYSLRALAASDFFLLMFALMQQVVPVYVHHIGCESNLFYCSIQGYISLYAWPMVCIFQMISIWLTMLISAERFLAICYPLKSLHVRSLRKIRLMIGAVVCLCVIYNLPRFFEFTPSPKHSAKWNITVIHPGDTPLRRHLVYRYFYNTALFCLLVYIIPLVTLVTLNFKTITGYRKCLKLWDHLNRNQKKEVKATVIPIVIVIVFILTNTQSLIVFVLDAIYLEGTVPPDWFQFYIAIVNCLIIFGSAANFLIFYCFGQKFRSLLWKCVRCDRSRTIIWLDWSNRTVSKYKTTSLNNFEATSSSNVHTVLGKDDHTFSIVFKESML